MIAVVVSRGVVVGGWWWRVLSVERRKEVVVEAKRNWGGGKKACYLCVFRAPSRINPFSKGPARCVGWQPDPRLNGRPGKRAL